jgi:hypothetical protein
MPWPKRYQFSDQDVPWFSHGGRTARETATTVEDWYDRLLVDQNEKHHQRVADGVVVEAPPHALSCRSPILQRIQILFPETKSTILQWI